MQTQQIKVEEGAKNLPEIKFRAGAIVATVWSNESTTKEGEKVAYKTVSFERTYRDKDGNWQTTNSLRMNDLPKAMLVLSKAYEHLALKGNIIEEEA